MTFGSLFSGCGGIDLGLEKAGMRCQWQVEKDQYALRVLEKHWPTVARYRDVRFFLGSKRWRRVREAWSVDLVAGGFPCQDISNAGRRVGIGGERSGLWTEFARIVRLLRPRYVLVENVPALTIRGLDVVLGDLAAIGYDAEWDCIPAAALGAPHLRWRLFIVAYAGGRGVHQQHRRSGGESRQGAVLSGRDGEVRHVAELADAARKQFQAYCQGQRDLYWPEAQPPVCGVDDGVPDRVHQLRVLGNAVLPPVVQWIGERIMALEEKQRCTTNDH